MLCTSEWQLLRERKNNCKHLCLVHMYKKPSSQKEVHCPTKRQGTWWTLPLILSLCRWLLPPFYSCIWFLIFLGSVHQEACRKLLEKEQRTQWNRGWSYPANTKVIPCPLLSYEDTPHITTTSKPGLLFPWTTEVFLDALIATEVPKPCLQCLIKEVFIYAGVFWKVLHKCQEKRRLWFVWVFCQSSRQLAISGASL